MDSIFATLSAGASIKKKSKDRKSSKSSKMMQKATTSLDFFGAHPKLTQVVNSDSENYESSDSEKYDDSCEDLEEESVFEDIKAIRNKLGVKVRGKLPIPDLITTFDDMPFNLKIKSNLLKNIENLSFWKEPTPVQMQAIPVLLSGRDLLAIAPTGSGKTAAYVLPILSMLAEKPAPRRGIRALVLVPTRELCDQIDREISRLSTGRKVNVCLLKKSLIKSATNFMSSTVTDGNEKLDYFSKYDVLLTTPMKLLSYLGGGAGGGNVSIDLGSVEMIVLDEVDKLFEHDSRPVNDRNDGEKVDADEYAGGTTESAFPSSFLSQVDAILASCPSRGDAPVVKGLFSATITPFVQELANGFLHDHVGVNVGVLNSGASAIEQSLVFAGNEQGKLLAVRQLVTQGKLKPPVLLFVQSIDRAKQLYEELIYDGINVDVIHSDRTQAQREASIAKFRGGSSWVLICTDLLARGIDFKHVNMVINYDLPTTPVSYIHRIGRTGRAGRSGEAITFFTEHDIANLRAIANVMKLSGCDVPDWMLNIKQLKTKEKRQLRRFCPKRHDISDSHRFEQKQRARKKKLIEDSKGSTKKSRTTK